MPLTSEERKQIIEELRKNPEKSPVTDTLTDEEYMQFKRQADEYASGLRQIAEIMRQRLKDIDNE